jgi:hypothetical protein
VLPSKRQPPVRNRLADGAYIGYQGKWVSQPNTIINITINNTSSSSVTLLREDGTQIAIVTVPTYTVVSTDITNTLGDIIATAQAAGEPVEIPLQTAEGTTGLGDISFPANTVGVIPNVNWTDSDGSPMSNPYGSDISCTPVVCPTLDELVVSSTNQQVYDAIVLASKECFIQGQLLDRYKVGGFASIGSFGTLAGSNGASMVYNGLIYITSLNNVLIYNATTYALQTTVTGFNGASEMAMSPDGSQYAVVNFSGNTVRIMDTAANTQIASFATIASPWTVSYNAAGTELYISTITTSTITRYNLAGSTLGTVTGFDGRILEVRRVGTNYHVLTATGTAGASTQRVRVMDFATNTEQSTHSLGTVTTIGTVQSIAIEGSSAYLCALKGSGNTTTLFVYEYNLSYALQRGENTCINGTNLWGVAYNPANCGTLVLPCTQLTTTINLIV